MHSLLEKDSVSTASLSPVVHMPVQVMVPQVLYAVASVYIIEFRNHIRSTFMVAGHTQANALEHVYKEFPNLRDSEMQPICTCTHAPHPDTPMGILWQSFIFP